MILQAKLIVVHVIKASLWLINSIFGLWCILLLGKASIANLSCLRWNHMIEKASLSYFVVIEWESIFFIFGCESCFCATFSTLNHAHSTTHRSLTIFLWRKKTSAIKILLPERLVQSIWWDHHTPPTSGLYSEVWPSKDASSWYVAHVKSLMNISKLDVIFRAKWT